MSRHATDADIFCSEPISRGRHIIVSCTVFEGSYLYMELNNFRQKLTGRKKEDLYTRRRWALPFSFTTYICAVSANFRAKVVSASIHSI